MFHGQCIAVSFLIVCAFHLTYPADVVDELATMNISTPLDKRSANDPPKLDQHNLRTVINQSIEKLQTLKKEESSFMGQIHLIDQAQKKINKYIEEKSLSEKSEDVELTFAADTISKLKQNTSTALEEDHILTEQVLKQNEFEPEFSGRLKKYRRKILDAALSDMSSSTGVRMESNENLLRHTLENLKKEVSELRLRTTHVIEARNELVDRLDIQEQNSDLTTGRLQKLKSAIGEIQRDSHDRKWKMAALDRVWNKDTDDKLKKIEVIENERKAINRGMKQHKHLFESINKILKVRPSLQYDNMKRVVARMIQNAHDYNTDMTNMRNEVKEIITTVKNIMDVYTSDYVKQRNRFM